MPKQWFSQKAHTRYRFSCQFLWVQCTFSEVVNAEMWALQAPNSHGPIASYQKKNNSPSVHRPIIIFRMANGLGRRPVMANLNFGGFATNWYLFTCSCFTYSCFAYSCFAYFRPKSCISPTCTFYTHVFGYQCDVIVMSRQTS